MNAATQASYLCDGLQHNTGLNSGPSCVMGYNVIPAYTQGPCVCFLYFCFHSPQDRPSRGPPLVAERSGDWGHPGSSSPVSEPALQLLPSRAGRGGEGALLLQMSGCCPVTRPRLPGCQPGSWLDQWVWSWGGRGDVADLHSVNF